MSPKKPVVVSLPSRVKNAYQLLSYVCKLILEEPKRYNQELYFDFDKTHLSVCGTVACVAGWVSTLKGPGIKDADNAGPIAARVLGLNTTQAHDLFSGAALYAYGEHVRVGKDPAKQDLIASQPQTVAYARLGVKHIRKFMKEHETQLKAKAVVR